MNIWLLPTQNVILNTLIRSIILVIVMVFGLGTTVYTAYWGAIIHDTISLLLIRPYL